MSAKKTLVASIALLGLFGCGEIKSPTFEPVLFDFVICEKAANANACPTNGEQCRLTNATVSASSPSLVALNRSVQYCALARYDALQGSGDDVSRDTNTPWQDVTSRTKWLSADSSVVSIDSEGEAYGATTGGPVKITASFEGYTPRPTTFLKVTPAALADIAIQPDGDLETIVGNQIQFKCRGSFTAACATNGQSICDITNSADFAPTNNGFFSVASGGLGKALAATAQGQRVNVTCSDKDVSKQPPKTLTSDPASIAVCAASSITSLEIVPNALRLPVGQTEQLQLLANYTSCTTGQPAQLDVTTVATWSSTDDAVAPVDVAGIVSGLAPGQAEITGSFGGVDSSPLLVIVSNTVVDSIRVEGPTFAFAVPGQSTALDYTAFALLADIDTLEVIDEVELLDAPAQPFATWASDSAAITFANVTVSSAALDGSAVAQSVEISATYDGKVGTLTTNIFDLASVKGLEITPSLACIADELAALAILGDPAIQLTAHATVEPIGPEQCSLPVTNFVNWGTGTANLTSGLLSNINIPVLGPILAGIVTGILGDCEESGPLLLPITVGEDFGGSPVAVTNEVPKGIVFGNPETLNLAGGSCVRAYIGPPEAALFEAFSAVLAAVPLQAVCNPLLVVSEPSVAACP